MIIVIIIIVVAVAVDVVTNQLKANAKNVFQNTYKSIY